MYPITFALCTYFIETPTAYNVFGSIFIIPLVFASWTWGLKRGLVLAFCGTALNLIIIIFDLAVLKHRTFGPLEIIFGFFFGLVLYAIVGCAVGGMGDANRGLKKALFEVKVLRGLIPICAKCKQIRDDQGYWRQLEEYIREHSEANFSHGLCPKCAHELYGDPLVPPEAPRQAVR